MAAIDDMLESWHWKDVSMNPRLIIEASEKEPNAVSKKNLALLRHLAALLPGVRVVLFPAEIKDVK